MLRFANVSSYCFRCLFSINYKELYTIITVILRNKSVGGDKTSKIFEDESPRALGGESKNQSIFCSKYIVYGGFDKIIHTMDKSL
jgi:hypothetical protein